MPKNMEQEKTINFLNNYSNVRSIIEFSPEDKLSPILTSRDFVNPDGKSINLIIEFFMWLLFLGFFKSFDHFDIFPHRFFLGHPFFIGPLIVFSSSSYV